MFEKYVALSQPAVHLRSTTRSPFTRLGGSPRLPVDLDWPDVDGQALPFLLQVDLAEVHAVLPSFLPAIGALFFFFDDKRYCGGYSRDRHFWRVLYHPGSVVSLPERTGFAALADEQVYVPRSLCASRIDSLPSHYRFPGEFDAEGDLQAYVELSLRPLGDDLAHHQMLGHAGLLQPSRPEWECELRSRGIDSHLSPNDPSALRFLDSSRDWRLLCQIDTDEEAGWMWGDAGTIFFWIRESDVKRADFTLVWMTMDCL